MDDKRGSLIRFGIRPIRMSWLLCVLRNPQRAARIGLVDSAAAARRRLETVATRQDALCRATQAERVTRPGGSNRRELSRPMATQQKSGLALRIPDHLLRFVRTSQASNSTRLTNRTAVYGPVRTVV